jgi:hypothetical protein
MVLHQVGEQVECLGTDVNGIALPPEKARLQVERELAELVSPLPPLL